MAVGYFSCGLAAGWSNNVKFFEDRYQKQGDAFCRCRFMDRVDRATALLRAGGLDLNSGFYHEGQLGVGHDLIG